MDSGQYELRRSRSHYSRLGTGNAPLYNSLPPRRVDHRHQSAGAPQYFSQVGAYRYRTIYDQFV